MSEERLPEAGNGPDDVQDEELPQDDIGGEPEEGGEPERQEPEEQPARGERQGRRDQNQRLREQRQELIRDNAELKARIARLEQAQQQRPGPDPAAQQAAEQERWQRYRQAIDAGQISVVDAIRDIYQHGQQTFQQQMLAQQQAINDRIDKQAFQSAAVGSKLHRDYAARVEQTLAAERAAGNAGVTRDAILKYLVGEDAMARAMAGAPTQRRQAAQRVAGAQARPTGAAGDGSRPAARRERDDDEALLRGITIEDI